MKSNCGKKYEKRASRKKIRAYAVGAIMVFSAETFAPTDRGFAAEKSILETRLRGGVDNPNPAGGSVAPAPDRWAVANSGAAIRNAFVFLASSATGDRFSNSKSLLGAIAWEPKMKIRIRSATAQSPPVSRHANRLRVTRAPGAFPTRRRNPRLAGFVPLPEPTACKSVRPGAR